MELIIATIALAGFGLAAMRWGANSTDGPNSPEWDRRHAWRGFRR